MIGLIAPNLSSTRLWRDQTKVPVAISPWLQDPTSFAGLRLTAIICLPSWEERPGNVSLLRMARSVLVAGVADDDVTLERATPALDYGNPAHAIEPPPERSIIDPLWNPAPARPALGDEDDRAAGLRHIAGFVYDAMSPDERAHLTSLIRAPGTGNPAAIRQYVETMQQRYTNPVADRAVGDRLRTNHINQLVDYMGEGERVFLEGCTEAQITTLLRMVQEIRLIDRTDSDPNAQVDARRRFITYLTDLLAERGVPTQRVSRPPTSGPATGGRTVGRSIPFADIFAPTRRRQLREDDL